MKGRKTSCHSGFRARMWLRSIRRVFATFYAGIRAPAPPTPPFLQPSVPYKHTKLSVSGSSSTVPVR
ncbi:hypothetical protein CgunFtcFv8_009349 [Champsocephalus gunnari]|uniref:Uncharacterized protein n=1 Tax=Champsocephalus gunnari TaxID=52237 RepID=A0AAN8C227_CHAGU|nr:hypothetical protein CgunFtcFv8_009349 [Champsocephalus gunnari]